MARSYLLLDLREWVVATVGKKGMSRREAAARLGVGISTGSTGCGARGAHETKFQANRQSTLKPHSASSATSPCKVKSLS